jgi:outer membrane protein TolC
MMRRLHRGASLAALSLLVAAVSLAAQAAAPAPETPLPPAAPAAKADAASSGKGDESVLVLSLDEAVDLALRNNLGVKAERLRLDEVKWARAANWNVFLPKASLTAFMFRSNLSDADRMQLNLMGFQAYAASGFTGDFPTYTVPRWGAQFLLDVGFSLSAVQFVYVKQTAIDYRMGLVSEQIAEKRLVRDVKKLYYSLLLLQESVKVFEESRDLAQKRLDLARAREKIGSASEIDVLAEEVGLEAIVPQIIEQRDSYETALANFKLLLGVKRNASLRLSGELEVPRTGEGRGQAGLASTDEASATSVDEASALGKLGSRLDLAYLRGAIDALKNKLAGDVAGMTPALFVKWTADPTFQRDIMDSSTWSGASFSDLWKQNTGALSFGLSVPLDPLLPKSGARTDMARSKLQVEEAELGYRSALEGAEIEVLSILRQLDKSTKLMAASDKSVTLAERLYAAAEKAYASGAKNYLELQDALGKLNAARFERLRDKHGYLSALGDLEFALTAGDFASK